MCYLAIRGGDGAPLRRYQPGASRDRAYDSSRVRTCLRAYAAMDGVAFAEQVLAAAVVKPFMDAHFTRSRLDGGGARGRCVMMQFADPLSCGACFLTPVFTILYPSCVLFQLRRAFAFGNTFVQSCNLSFSSFYTPVQHLL